MSVCVCVCACALTIISTDKILRFINTFITVIIIILPDMINVRNRFDIVLRIQYSLVTPWNTEEEEEEIANSDTQTKTVLPR